MEIKKEMEKKKRFEKIEQEIEKFIKQEDKLWMNTERCHLWKEENHNKCSGCPSELGCRKRTILTGVIVQMIGNALSSRDLPEKSFKDILEKVLGSKTIEELEEIPNLNI